MNDLPMAVKNPKISLHPDDTFVSNKTKSKLEIGDELYPDFIKICKWLKADKLSPNFLKIEFMVIGNLRKYGELKGLPALRVGDSLIRRVKQTKSLGVIIDQNLSWDSHIEYIFKKIKRNIGILRRLGNTVPQHSLITLYKTLIEPYFRYYSTIWGYCNDSQVKNHILQNKAVRIVTFSKYQTANHPQLLKDFEWLSVHNLIKFDTAALMYKVHNEIIPDPIIALFDKTEAIHKYSTRSVTNEDYFFETN